VTGEFQALDATTGKLLWSFQIPSGIVGQPGHLGSRRRGRM
jgi:alcohol dehydrogenase (cytochrome c)